jgi:segregation and condensation protein A
MSIAIAADNQAPSLAGYQLHLPDFEGPLDVLLRLVERSQLAITDVSLVAVLDQFLAYVDALEGRPPSVIAEFTTVGTRLTLLKSRSLLPRPPVVDEDEEPADLTAQLIEYKRLKDAAKRLAEIQSTGTASFAMPAPKTQDFAKDATHFRLASYEVKTLWRSVRRRVAHIPRPEQVLDHRPILSLRDVISRVMALVTPTRTITFASLVAPYHNRTEVATAFLATLVLMRRRVIDAEQVSLFGDIQLHKAADETADLDDEALTEFDPA